MVYVRILSFYSLYCIKRVLNNCIYKKKKKVKNLIRRAHYFYNTDVLLIIIKTTLSVRLK